MRYTISGKNIDITPGLREAAESKIGKLERYFSPDTEVQVTMSVEKGRQKIEVTIPTREQKTDKTTEHTVTDLKLLNRHIADSDGKTISAEIKREPTRFIARTIITATITAIKRL